MFFCFCCNKNFKKIIFIFFVFFENVAFSSWTPSNTAYSSEQTISGLIRDYNFYGAGVRIQYILGPLDLYFANPMPIESRTSFDNGIGLNFGKFYSLTNTFLGKETYITGFGSISN